MFTRASMRARAEAGNCNEHMPENAKSNTTVRFGIRGARRRAPTDLRFPIGVGDRPSRVGRRGSETAVRARARAAVTSRFEILVVVTLITAPRRDKFGVMVKIMGLLESGGWCSSRCPSSCSGS